VRPERRLVHGAIAIEFFQHQLAAIAERCRNIGPNRDYPGALR
jgi:hypothetical protein